MKAWVKGPQIHIGLRGPLLSNGDAAILSISVSSLFGERKGEPPRLSGDPPGLPLKRRGIRDSAAFGSEFLIVAGPVLDPPPKVPIKAGKSYLQLIGGRAN